MNSGAFSDRFSARFRPVWRAIFVGVLGGLVLASGVEAKTKKLDKKIVDTAVSLGKDREAAFTREKAMSIEEFKENWQAFAQRLDETYAGHEIKLKTFGPDVRSRKGFTHLLYMVLKVQTAGTVLKPSVQELVAKHPFLQELILEGSCYTGGDPFPKKMRDLIKAQPGMQYLIREHLTAWNGEYRTLFEKEFPNVQ